MSKGKYQEEIEFVEGRIKSIKEGIQCAKEHVLFFGGHEKYLKDTARTEELLSALGKFERIHKALSSINA